MIYILFSHDYQLLTQGATPGTAINRHRRQALKLCNKNDHNDASLHQIPLILNGPWLSQT